MSSLDRTYWLAVALCAYIGAASMQHAGPTRLGLAALIAIPLGLSWVWKHTRRGRRKEGEHPTTLSSARAVAIGVALWLTARVGAPQVPALELAAALGAGLASTAATFALARIPAAPGLLKPSPSVQSIDAAAFTAALWTVALVVALARVLAAESIRLDPLTLDYANTAASIASLLVLIAATWRVRFVRRLELGVGDRAAGALAFSVTCLAVGIPAAAADVAAPDRVMPVAVLVASIATVGCVILEDARKIAQVLRAILVLCVLGIPAALLTGAVAQRHPDQAGLIALIGSALALLIGLVTKAAARPLGPEQSRWLDAIAQAAEGALVPEPQQAVIRTLSALKATSTSPTAKPQLWLFEPPLVQSVDVAGYLHEESADAPENLRELAEQEPELTLRVEVLEALQVRRPQVRPLLDWFKVRNAFCATLITDEDGTQGFLLLPKGDRRSEMTLEEARAVRQLAERLSSLLSVTAALSRSRIREATAVKEADYWQEEYQRARAVLAGEGERQQGLARTLAEPLVSSAYSPAARLALSGLERAAQNFHQHHIPALVMFCPVGVDPVPWAAATHLAMSSGRGPLVVIDGAQEARKELRRFQDPTHSPWALSRGGTLLFKDLELAPTDLQLLLADMLTRPEQPKPETAPRRGAAAGPTTTGGAPPPACQDALPRPLLIFTVNLSLEELTSQGRLVPALRTLIEKQLHELPPLSDRPEDLRSMVLGALAKAPARPDGSSLGINRRALQALMDHEWPGNERELLDLVARAAAFADGPQLGPEELSAAGFNAAMNYPLPDPPSPGSGATLSDQPVAAATAATVRRRPRSSRSRRSKR